MSDPVILAQELRKSYGAFEAVRGIDFEVEPGTSFGLLGPNGAGKSTTMRMIAGVSHRSGGRLRILGMDPDEQGPRIRAHLGVVPQNDNLDAQLTVRENLIFYGRYFGLPKRWLAAKAEELIEFAQLADKCAREIADKTTVIPVTTETITEHLDSREVNYAFHDDGAVCMMFSIGHYWFSVSPEEGNMSLLARIETPASLDLRPALVEVCNDWNSRTRWPKTSVYVNDDGKAFVYAEMHLTLRGGITRATVSTNIDRFVSTSQQFFTHVGERFPSLAYSPEE